MQRKYFYFLQYFNTSKNVWINENIYEDRELALEKYHEALINVEKYRLVEEIIIVQARNFLTKW